MVVQFSLQNMSLASQFKQDFPPATPLQFTNSKGVSKYNP